LVTVDHAVNELLVTTIQGNPKVSIIGCGLHVTSLFTRLKASGKGRRGRNTVGDNCHMLYALKQKDGLVTNFASVRLLTQSGRKILETLAAQVRVDTVVYMPSAYSLSAIMAKRCSEAFGAQLVEGVFRKSTKLESYAMLRTAELNGHISAADKKALDFRMKKSAGFSLKDIPVRYRPLFTPLHCNPTFQGEISGSVLLVDDLLASGQTLSVAAALVRQMPGVTAVQALCIFSDV